MNLIAFLINPRNVLRNVAVTLTAMFFAEHLLGSCHFSLRGTIPLTCWGGRDRTYAGEIQSLVGEPAHHTPSRFEPPAGFEPATFSLPWRCATYCAKEALFVLFRVF